MACLIITVDLTWDQIKALEEDPNMTLKTICVAENAKTRVQIEGAILPRYQIDEGLKLLKV